MMKRISKIIDDDCALNPLSKYRGRSCVDVNSELSLGINFSSKSYVRQYIDRITSYENIDVDSRENIIKTIRMDATRQAKESMALRVVDYCDMVNQSWENSDLRDELSKTYLFFIFSSDGAIESTIFEGIVKYRFSRSELQRANGIWEDTVNKIISGRFDHFITEKESGDFFFKIHAANIHDTKPTPDGGRSVKRSFWIAKRFLNSYVIPRLN